MIYNSNENSLMDDANSPEINKKLMGFVAEDFVKVAEYIKEASYQIRKRKFSDFPIFTLSQETVEFGQLLFDKADFQTRYHYRASMVEEFIQRTLMSEDSKPLFLENYKNADEFACLFIWDEGFAGFVFLPYPED
ncbi:MAG: hypothetical protein ACK4LB_08835 [Spirosomataceae bacterium]